MVLKIILYLFLFTTLLNQAQDIDSVKIGSGGGITGSVTVYKFQKKQVLKGKGVAFIKYTEKATICGKKRKSLLLNAQNILKEGIEVNQPGNKYEFIEIYSKNKSIKIIWSKSTDSNNGINPSILSQIENIKAIIQNLKFNTL